MWHYQTVTLGREWLNTNVSGFPIEKSSNIMFYIEIRPVVGLDFCWPFFSCWSIWRQWNDDNLSDFVHSRTLQSGTQLSFSPWECCQRWMAAAWIWSMIYSASLNRVRCSFLVNIFFFFILVRSSSHTHFIQVYSNAFSLAVPVEMLKKGLNYVITNQLGIF